MKKILCVFLALTLLASLTACGKCDHDWEKATCDTPKTCEKCGEIEGSVLGHKWADATCDGPKTCQKCGKTDGTALTHVWAEATYEAPRTCILCGVTDGESLSQKLVEQLVGTWVVNIYMDQFLEGFTSENGLPIAFIFTADGTYVQVPYEQEFDDALAALKADLRDYLVQQIYQAAAEEGYSEKQADDAFRKKYSVTIHEYAEAEVEEMGWETIADQKTSGDYTLVGDQLTLEGRQNPLTLTISLSGDTLQILECNNQEWISLLGDYPVELQRKD